MDVNWHLHLQFSVKYVYYKRNKSGLDQEEKYKCLCAMCMHQQQTGGGRCSRQYSGNEDGRFFFNVQVNMTIILTPLQLLLKTTELAILLALSIFFR